MASILRNRKNDLNFLFLQKFTLDSLLEFETRDTSVANGVSQPLLVPALAIMMHQLCETLRFGLPGDKLLDKRYIDTNPIGNAAGANFVGVKFRHNANLLLPRMVARARVPIWG